MGSNFEAVTIPLPGGESLFGQFLHCDHAPRMLFLPPVVGAAAGLQLMSFRPMVKRGCSLFSFEYRGHRRSTGKFSIVHTVDDTRAVLEWIAAYCQSRRLELHCSSMSYGAIPLLAALPHPINGLPIRSLSAVGGLFDIISVLNWRDFTRFYAPEGDVTAEEVLRAISQGTMDYTAPRFWSALRAYLQSLLPDIKIGVGNFGELEYTRTEVVETAVQFYAYQPLANFTTELPTYIIYGTNDTLLGLDTEEGQQQYLATVQRLLPHARLFSANIDHFGRGPDREQVADTLSAFLVECEQAKTVSVV